MKNTSRREYTIDFTERTLTLSASFAAKANDPTSDEYAIVCRILRDFPALRIVRKTHKSPAKPNKHSGLTYERMERFILAVSPKDDTDYLEAFYTVREMAEATCASPYAVVSAWFMKQFPKFRSNPLFYLDERPAIIDFSAVLDRAAKKPAVVKAEGDEKSA